MKKITDIRGARAEVKKNLDIVKVVTDEMGPPPKTVGQDSFWNCPFHGESSPSFGVHAQLQVAKCFGCGVGGDVVTWTQNYFGLSHQEAIRHLADKYSINISAYEVPLTPEELQIQRYHTICDEAAKFCSTQLFSNKVILDWYKSDTGFSLEQIADYDVGYSQSFDSLIQHLFKTIPGITQDDITKLEFDNRLLWNNTLVYPIRNHAGQTTRFYNKPLTPPPEFGGKYIGTSHKHPLFTHKLLYGFHLLRKNLKDHKYSVRIVEGQKAAIASGGVAIMGSSIHEEQINLLQEYQVKEIRIAFDGDEAGRAASIRVLDQVKLMNNLHVLVARIPDDMQPDGVIRERGRAALDDVFAKAGLPIQFYVELKRQPDGSISTADRAAIVQELKDYLGSLPDIHLDITAKYLADQLQVDTNSIKTYVGELKLTQSGLLNRDAEMCVLRHVLFNPRAWSTVRQVITDPKTFTIPANQYLFTTLDSIHKKARDASGAESVTVQAVKDEMNVVFPQFRDLNKSVDTVLTYEPKYEFVDALQRIVDLYRRRVGIEQSKIFANMMGDIGRNTNDAISKFRRQLVSSIDVRKDESTTPIQLAESVMLEIQERMTKKNSIIGYDFTNIIDVDGQKHRLLPALSLALSGLQPKHQIVLSANTGVGKSIMALQMATSISICPEPADQVPALWIALEMSTVEITMRVISQITGIDNNKVQRGQFTEEEFQKYKKALEMISRGQLYIKKPRTGTADEIFSIIDEYHFKYGIKACFLDYIQMMTPSDTERKLAKHEVIGKASKMLKNQIAEPMGIAMVTIGQQNRKDFKHGDSGRVEGAAGSYEIAQDADDYLILSEKNEDQLTEERGMRGNRRGFIDKRRGGASDIMLDLDLDTSIFCNLRFIEKVPPEQMAGLMRGMPNEN